ncbi:hypothetical protein AB1Y20_014590 [Prymnesium parvum]|uniref:Uncharacterized protein n=1 Tax=Prymnesium parvum TaxID=97485 RepID=A0AB34IET2_PRYPA
MRKVDQKVPVVHNSCGAASPPPNARYVRQLPPPQPRDWRVPRITRRKALGGESPSGSMATSRLRLKLVTDLRSCMSASDLQAAFAADVAGALGIPPDRISVASLSTPAGLHGVGWITFDVRHPGGTSHNEVQVLLLQLLAHVRDVAIGDGALAKGRITSQLDPRKGLMELVGSTFVPMQLPPPPCAHEPAASPPPARPSAPLPPAPPLGLADSLSRRVLHRDFPEDLPPPQPQPPPRLHTMSPPLHQRQPAVRQRTPLPYAGGAPPPLPSEALRAPPASPRPMPHRVDAAEEGSWRTLREASPRLSLSPPLPPPPAAASSVPLRLPSSTHPHHPPLNMTPPELLLREHALASVPSVLSEPRASSPPRVEFRLSRRAWRGEHAAREDASPAASFLGLDSDGLADDIRRLLPSAEYRLSLLKRTESREILVRLEAPPPRADGASFPPHRDAAALSSALHALRGDAFLAELDRRHEERSVDGERESSGDLLGRGARALPRTSSGFFFVAPPTHVTMESGSAFAEGIVDDPMRLDGVRPPGAAAAPYLDLGNFSAGTPAVRLGSAWGETPLMARIVASAAGATSSCSLTFAMFVLLVVACGWLLGARALRRRSRHVSATARGTLRAPSERGFSSLPLPLVVGDELREAAGSDCARGTSDTTHAGAFGALPSDGHCAVKSISFTALPHAAQRQQALYSRPASHER